MFKIISQLGWLYGSVTEDVLTGLFIQSRGWKSAYCLPDPAAFLGCAPTAGPATMIQQKRWATGLFEVLFNTKSPIIGTLFGKLQLRQCMAYLYVQLWALRSIFEVCYAILPAYCLITNSYFLPKVRILHILKIGGIELLTPPLTFKVKNRNLLKLKFFL